MAATADYSKLKNAELESLLKERSLPHTGKKAEMVARLVEHDKSRNASKPADSSSDAASKAATPAPAPSTVPSTSAVTSEPAAAAVAAGGTVRVDNPVAVPNQTQVEDPSTTNDLSVSAPATAAVSGGDKATAEATDTKAAAPTAEELKAAKEAEAAKFSSHMPATDIDAELEKRKARAKKFGIEETNAEAVKALERAKRFGTGTAGEQSAGEGLNMMKGLDEALPERGQRKRGRAPTTGGDSFDDEGLKRRRGQGRRDFRGGRGGPSRQKSDRSVPKARNGHPSWMSDKDKDAAEKRKARFA